MYQKVKKYLARLFKPKTITLEQAIVYVDKVFPNYLFIERVPYVSMTYTHPTHPDMVVEPHETREVYVYKHKLEKLRNEMLKGYNEFGEASPDHWTSRLGYRSNVIGIKNLNIAIKKAKIKQTYLSKSTREQIRESVKETKNNAR